LCHVCQLTLSTYLCLFFVQHRHNKYKNELSADKWHSRYQSKIALRMLKLSAQSRRRRLVHYSVGTYHWEKKCLHNGWFKWLTYHQKVRSRMDHGFLLQSDELTMKHRKKRGLKALVEHTMLRKIVKKIGSSCSQRLVRTAWGRWCSRFEQSMQMSHAALRHYNSKNWLLTFHQCLCVGFFSKKRSIIKCIQHVCL
jgi:hypothetical protein